MKHRVWNRLRAEWGHYFWLPCPLCGQEFGGHEWRDIDGLVSSIPNGKRGGGTGICPDCTRAGKGYREPLTMWDAGEADETVVPLGGIPTFPVFPMFNPGTQMAVVYNAHAKWVQDMNRATVELNDWLGKRLSPDARPTEETK